MLLLPKYHGLGNDYFLWDPTRISRELTEDAIRRICDRHTGPGSDGILEGPFLPDTPQYTEICRTAAKNGISSSSPLCAVRIWNPDGSEAEKSGNGARIFSQYLFDAQRVTAQKDFCFATRGGVVHSRIQTPFQAIRCEMGLLQFTHPDFPDFPEQTSLHTLSLPTGEITFCPVSIGNPHCVVFHQELSPENACKLGPQLECHPAFPRRINVQFLRILSLHEIRIEIWERGAGYTLASGTSACAAAAAAIHQGFCQSPVQVHSPGGILMVEIQNLRATLTGPVTFVYTAELQETFLT